MKYKENMQEVKQRFEAWWKHSNADRPLLSISARRSSVSETLEAVRKPQNAEEVYTDVESLVKRYRNYLKTHTLFAEAYPSLDVNLGAGSLALYLGSEPVFAPDTVWFKECIEDLSDYNFQGFNPENHWWKKHLELISKAQELSAGDFYVNIPDIVENIDILSAMRGPQNTCYDLIDEPGAVHKFIKNIDDVYFKYYNAMYDIVKDKEGYSSFTAFKIIGSGRTAKVQCDFCALMSPRQFIEFVQPSLRKQCAALDHSLYHLDGPDAIKHLDALMQIEELDALQWTSGAGKPDGASELWYPIYDKVINAGKSLWITIYDDGFNDWVSGAEKLVRRYGSKNLYLLFPDMEEAEAERLMLIAEREWK